MLRAERQDRRGRAKQAVIVAENLLAARTGAPLDPTRPRRLMWLLKASVLPSFYWWGMLKGREWLTRASRG